MKILFIILIILGIVSCYTEQDLYAVEKPFTLVKIDSMTRGGELRWKLLWSNPDSLKITTFRGLRPVEKVGDIKTQFIILANWEKDR